MVGIRNKLIEKLSYRILQRIILFYVIVHVVSHFIIINNEVFAGSIKNDTPTLSNPSCVKYFSGSSSRLFKLLSLDGTVKLDSNYYPDFSSVDPWYFTKVITQFKKLTKTIIKEIKKEPNPNFDNIIKKIDEVVWFRLRFASMIEFWDMKQEKKERLLKRLRGVLISFLGDIDLLKVIDNYDPSLENLTDSQEKLVQSYKELVIKTQQDISNIEAQESNSISQAEELYNQISEKYSQIETRLEFIPNILQTDFYIRSIVKHDRNKDELLKLFSVINNRVYIDHSSVKTVLSKLTNTEGRRLLYERYSLQLQSNASAIYREFVEISSMYKQLIEQGAYSPDRFVSTDNIKKILESRIEKITDKLFDDETDMYKFVSSHFSNVYNQDLIYLDPWNIYYYNEWYNESKRYSKLFGSKLGAYLHYDKLLENILNIFSELYGVDIVEVTSDKYFKLFKKSKVYEVKKDGKLIMILHISQNSSNRNNSSTVNSYPYTMFIDKKTKTFESYPATVAIDLKLRAARRHDGVCSLDDVITMFHELGHAFGGLLLTPVYSSMNNETNDMYCDVEEYQSKFMEFFARDPKIIRIYAKHFKTGESMNDQQIEALLYDGRMYLADYLSELVMDYINLLIQRGEFIGIEDIYSKFKLPRYVQDECNTTTKLQGLIGGESKPVLYHYAIGEYLGTDLFVRIKNRGFFSEESFEMMKHFLNFREFRNFDEFIETRRKIPAWEDIPVKFKFFK